MYDKFEVLLDTVQRPLANIVVYNRPAYRCTNSKTEMLSVYIHDALYLFD